MTAKIVNSDIWLLYKGKIIFHLITHDTDKNKSFSFETNSNVMIKQHIENNLRIYQKYLENFL